MGGYSVAEGKFHGIPLGQLLESSSSSQLRKMEKDTLPPLESWEDSAVPPVQVPCFVNKDTEGGSPGEGKGLELRSLHPSSGLLDNPGREEEGPRLELRAITRKGNELVPSL